MNIGQHQHPHITALQRIELNEATAFAAHRGWALTLAVTIHWALAGGPGSGTWRDRFVKLQERLRHWIARQGVPCASVWTVEQTERGKDVHSHLALHWPISRPLAPLESYLRHQLGGTDLGVLDVRRCSRHKRGINGWINYITKGLSPADHRKFRTPLKWRDPQGVIVGKRAGVAKSIGPTARAKHLDLHQSHQAAAAAQRMAKAAAAALRNQTAAAATPVQTRRTG